MAPLIGSLCLFAMHDGSNPKRLSPDRIQYICALCEQFEQVHVLTTSEARPENADQLPAAVLVFPMTNCGLDFGLWLRHVQTHLLQNDAEGPRLRSDITRLGLVNDSCVLVQPNLDALFGHPRVLARTLDFWGCTDSDFLGYHLQSYFLVLEPRALSVFAQFCRARDVSLLHTKNDVILGCEIALSTYMLAHNARILAVYPWRSVMSYFTNVVCFHGVPDLEAMGCPLLKRAYVDKQQPIVPMDCSKSS
jgi:hypothetical protein